MSRPLLAEQLLRDPRVAQAKRLLHDALLEHQQQLTGIRDPDPARTQTFAALIDAFSQQRGGKLYYPFLGSGIGRGPLVELLDGSVKYDFISGIGAHYFGHSHPGLLDAGLDAALSDTVMQGNLQQNDDSAQLVDLLLAQANRLGARMAHGVLTTSGAMANENLLKIAFQHRQPATRLLAFRGCFMGRTLALAQVTDRPQYREGLPATLNVDYVPFQDHRDRAAGTRRTLAALREHLHRHPGEHAALCLELVQGEAGYHTADADFFLAIIDVVREAGVLVLVDEIQTFGRTPQLFAYQHLGLDEQIDGVTIGKLSQVCATLYRAELAPRPGLVSQTFTGATSAIRAALAIVRELAEGDYFGDAGRITQLHDHFTRRLETIAAAHPTWVAGPFGLGAMIAFTAFAGRAEQAKAVAQALFEAGVIAFVAGNDPARVRFLPPVPVTQPQHIDEVCDILERVLSDLAAQMDA